MPNGSQESRVQLLGQRPAKSEHSRVWHAVISHYGERACYLVKEHQTSTGIGDSGVFPKGKSHPLLIGKAWLQGRREDFLGKTRQVNTELQVHNSGSSSHFVLFNDFFLSYFHVLISQKNVWISGWKWSLWCREQPWSCEMGGAWVWEQAAHREDVRMSDAKQPPCSQAAGDQIHVAKSFREF